MNNIHSTFGKALNSMVTGGMYNNYSTEDYIFASITQPPLKILDKNGSTDEFDYTVECPNCGKPVNYGSSIYMVSGHHYCSGVGCREMLMVELGRD